MTEKLNDLWGKTWILIKKGYASFIKVTVDNWTKHRKAVLYSYLLYFVVFGILLLIDQLTKTYIFEFAPPPNQNLGLFQVNRAAFNDLGIIGTRSVANPGITFAGNNTINVPAIQAISILANIAFLTVTYYFPLKSKSHVAIVIAFGGLAAGSLGNAIDRFAFGIVKDIFYAPYLPDRGTFNFSDSIVIGGGVLIVVNTLISIFYSDRKSKKQELFENKEEALKSQKTKTKKKAQKAKIILS